jgi:hypothetical protein
MSAVSSMLNLMAHAAQRFEVAPCVVVLIVVTVMHHVGGHHQSLGLASLA